jgi:AcrR family transcriptional regulator
MSQARSAPRTLDRDQILAVAVAHFARFGFRKTSLTEVAGQLGVVKGALYYHFPGGKLEIFDAAVSQVETELLEEMRKSAEAETDPRRALRALFATKFSCIRRRVGAHGVSPGVARELAAVPRDAQPFQLSERRLIEDVLARGEREGKFRKLRPRGAAAAAIQGMLREPIVGAALGTEPAPLRDGLPLHPCYFEILIEGLAPAPTTGENA